MERLSFEIASKARRNHSEIRPILKGLPDSLRIQAILHIQICIKLVSHLENHQSLWIQEQPTIQGRPWTYFEHIATYAKKNFIRANGIRDNIRYSTKQDIRGYTLDILPFTGFVINGLQHKVVGEKAGQEDDPRRALYIQAVLHPVNNFRLNPGQRRLLRRILP